MGRDARIERGLLAQLIERRRRVDAGDRALGWKLGMGVPAAMEKLGTSAPLVGYLLESARIEPGGSCDITGWTNPRLEPEVAVHMAASLGAGASREEAERAIAGMGAAIELVDPDPGADDPEAILAGNIFQRAVVLGPVAEGVPGTLSARIARDGEEVASAGDATEATGDLIDLVLHVAATLASAGEQLGEGDVVICGSIVPALEIAPGQELDVTVDPLGSVRVALV
jgi:2-keto-4-pentenoate hydratase